MSIETIYQVDNCIIKSHSFSPNNDIEGLQNEIIEGLLSKQKYISSKFFYDERGSELFEEITKLEEYYPTRAEKSILKSIAPKLMKNLKEIQLIELGSGDCSKISILLGAIDKKKHNQLTYTPIDISETAVLQATKKLKSRFKGINIEGIVTDFMSHPLKIANDTKKLFCFLGSTIGNLSRKQAAQFIKKISVTMQEGDRFLLGMDLIKNIEVVTKAYNDKKNVTAAFNKNILNSINSIIGTNFYTNDFEHLAFYNKEKARIEMHLVAKNDVNIYIPAADEIISIKKGENIHTENSHKFAKKDIFSFSEKANLQILGIHYDPEKYFCVVEFGK